MKRIAPLFLCLLAGCNDDDTAPPEVQLPQATALRHYSYVEAGPQLVVLISTGADATVTGTETDIMRRLSSELPAAGFSILALDLPCHGMDAEADQPLACWRRRIEAGDTMLFSNYCADLSAVLSLLAIDEAYVVGESRGGYVAATCAARDMRLTKVVMLKPVTDLQRLSEFSGYAVDKSIFGLGQYVDLLSRVPVLLRIGPNDTRVSTESALQFGESIGAEIEIVDSVGHRLPENGETLQWLIAD